MADNVVYSFVFSIWQLKLNRI